MPFGVLTFWGPFALVPFYRKHTIEYIDGIKVEFKEWNGVKIAVWIKEGYVFEIDFHNNVDMEIIKQIITSVK